jgi:hypothetical protein
MKLLRNLFYLSLVLGIGIISAYDNVISIACSETIGNTEQNPICKSIINYGGVEALVTAKSITTILATIILTGLVYTKYRCSIIFVFLFQLWLFWYLSFAGGGHIINTPTPMELFIDFYADPEKFNDPEYNLLIEK